MSTPSVLITGAAKRVGRSIALRLAREGYRVGIHYSTSREEAEKTAQECGNAEIFQADLEDVEQIRSLYEEVGKKFGRLDGLVNNAARFTKFDPLEITEADWDFIHSVNLKAVFFSCQQAARIMLEQENGGRIINISSMGGIRPWAQHAHYCASKAGVIHLTRSLALAFAPKITVNSIAPGVIPFGEENDPEVVALIRKTPAGRPGTGDDIAEGVLYFLRASSFVTGQTLAVDGGLTQK